MFRTGERPLFIRCLRCNEAPALSAGNSLLFAPQSILGHASMRPGD